MAATVLVVMTKASFSVVPATEWERSFVPQMIGIVMVVGSREAQTKVVVTVMGPV
jgi:hypothetical protein